jgi:hypothetical protein
MKIKDPNIAFAVWIQEMLGGFNVNVDFILGIDWAGVFSYRTLLCIIIFMFLCSIGLYLTVPKPKNY